MWEIIHTAYQMDLFKNHRAAEITLQHVDTGERRTFPVWTNAEAAVYHRFLENNEVFDG